MRDGSPKAIYRKDYQPPVFTTERVSLYINIFPGKTTVTATQVIHRNTDAGSDLVLDGENLKLQSVAIDGVSWAEDRYREEEGKLVVTAVPDAFELTTVVEICPEENSSLEGLYKSRTMYCTQCEAEGFRKITYYLDRPDVLALFEVTVEAEEASCPVLLSNGNLINKESLGNGRHRAVWQDPYPKPSYLFALVAGDLACVEDTFTTCSGRNVDLKIYVEQKDVGFCDHAMDSLKRSMKWDEEVYGLEYDLELFNIVAVDDFNMGAMENKSLNIFNTSAVLAGPDITTDMGYQRIEAIVAHEYFHNYSGNRVTCRDWFQLSLKEGFTVFRDSEFSSDMGSRGVKRVEDVAFLRTHQFAEDAGPMAHPVRPDSFIDISNFYTLTVYEKGAEVVRMLHIMLGAETFQRGASLYFERFDGQAVTCDDFVSAMEEASGRDLTQFRRWYEQAGTPQLTVTGDYDVGNRRYTLNIKQHNPDTAGQKDKAPLMMPIAVGLLVDGKPMPLEGESTTKVLELTEREQSFVFDDVAAAPTPSLLRGFSAPVRLTEEPTHEALITLMRGDDDEFVRWDAAQSYAAQVIEHVDEQGVPNAFLDAYADVLRADIDPAMKAHTLRLPTEDYLADRASQRGLVDVFKIRAQRDQVKRAVAKAFLPEWQALFGENAIDTAYQADGEQIGKRALRHLALDLCCEVAPSFLSNAEALLASADNLTDRLAALRAIVYYGDQALRESALSGFLEQWRDQALVVNQWFVVQAWRPDASVVEDVQKLQDCAVFDWKNPNKLRSLIGAFSNGNTLGFHRADGAGYRLLADAVVKIQAFNPQIASRMLTPLTQFKRYEHGQDMMKAQLERIASINNLPKDVFEVVSRSLAD